MLIVPIYASILALLFFILSVRIVRLRHKFRTSLGDAGHLMLQRAIRAHSNFAEYVPLCLLLLYFVEISGANRTFIHGLGICLMLGRISHAYSISQVNESLKFRVIGMALTFFPLLASSIYLLYRNVSHL